MMISHGKAVEFPVVTGTVRESCMVTESNLISATQLFQIPSTSAGLRGKKVLFSLSTF